MRKSIRRRVDFLLDLAHDIRHHVTRLARTFLDLGGWFSCEAD
ncbi:MAG TPA: hypothetical protein VIK53_03500 [Verrucomicrobiae bacterium]